MCTSVMGLITVILTLCTVSPRVNNLRAWRPYLFDFIILKPITIAILKHNNLMKVCGEK